MSNFIECNNEKVIFNGSNEYINLPVNIDVVQTIEKTDYHTDDRSHIFVIEFHGLTETHWYYNNESERNEEYGMVLMAGQLPRPIPSIY